ncbi:MraY family glycosyltransferase [Shimia sp. R9_3]|uniref:glycosyltransferase family 4 protein n=1 Tax=Shimia sp. R9_3 TaxID=2821113 RepID=UPI001ADC4ACA|nr:MraY family glycosyltransferase [Shimia sp. R9_3]MBO9399481.1 undecaprenyl/decaprenyl-phosphate alpha-N-acetylglucosaminyl 1-phosphate transferase [Shimia sp. R9_3]
MIDPIEAGYIIPMLVSFGVSFGLCCLFALVPSLFLNQEHMRNDLNARQAEHKRPTPRIGGVGVILGVAVTSAIYWQRIENDLIWALVATAVVFAVGLREDLHRDMSPKVRLLAAFASASLAMILTGALLPRLGVPFLDTIVGLTFVGVLLTLLWSAGACHALNLIDGLNGLASGYSMMASVAFFVIAGMTGDYDVQFVSGVLSLALLGFFVLNWPRGYLFLGDAGAYAIGHILSWLGIILLVRNPEGAGLAVLLVLFWPVADTAFAIWRRRMLDKGTDQPDRLHFHHLVVRALRIVFGKKLKSELYNPFGALVLFPFVAAPIIAGVISWQNGLLALLFLLLFGTLFIGTYVVSMNFFRNRKFGQKDVVKAPSNRPEVRPIEVSALSGIYGEGSQSTNLQIFKRSESGNWSIASKDQKGDEITIFDKFTTDHEAWDYFNASMAKD